MAKPILEFCGRGSNLNDDKLKSSRARKKLITQTLAQKLIKIAITKGDTKFLKSLCLTYKCLDKVYSENGKLYGKYCKNRICLVCSGNRKADKIHKYKPILETWKDPYFVTLTIRSVPAHRLPFIVDRGMIRAFKLINDKYRKRNKRGTGEKLIGIKSLEINFNPIKRTYNPHFHFIVPSKEVADKLTDEWLQLWTKKHALSIGQNSRPVEDLEHDLIEVIKYGNKIFTDPEMKKKKDRKLPPRIYIAAIYNILSAMKDHRLFGRFGFKLPKETNIKKEEVRKSQNYGEWNHKRERNNWANNETEQLLSDYAPTLDLLNLLENNIDCTTE